MSEIILENFKLYLSHVLALEEKLAQEEKIEDEYGGYRRQVPPPQPFKNVASLGMISMTACWAIFVAFAWFTGYKKISIGAGIFTIVLAGFFLFLKSKEKGLYQKKVDEYNEFMKNQKIMEDLEETKRKTRKVLDEFYEQELLFPRYRTYQAVYMINEYIVTGRCTNLSGADSVYKLYDEELQNGKTVDPEELAELPVGAIDEVPDYLEKLNTYLGSMESIA